MAPWPSFFAVVVAILQRSYVADRDFSDFTVAGRSFGGFYQAMAFLNTLSARPRSSSASSASSCGKGVLGIGIFSIMLCAGGDVPDGASGLDLGAASTISKNPARSHGALRFESPAPSGIIAALIGVAGLFPWMVLGMQSLGAVLHALSLGHLGFTTSVALGVVVMTVRQVWTIRMGMRGIVISDLFQGIVAYGLGSVLLVIVIVWLVLQGTTLSSVPSEHFDPPRARDAGAAAVLLLGLLPCSAACAGPTFSSGSTPARASAASSAPRPIARRSPLSSSSVSISWPCWYRGVPILPPRRTSAWFTLAEAAGGPWLLGLAGVVVFAASMGNTTRPCSRAAAQIANDVWAPPAATGAGWASAR